MGDLSKNFSRHEFACKCGCGFNEINPSVIDVLQDVRDHFNQKVGINSGCRCLEYNRKIGSHDSSQHVKGFAADIVVDSVHPDTVFSYLQQKRKGKGGFGIYDTFVHVDVRDNIARWDKRS